MHLTLLVPGLFLPDAIRADTTFDLPAPALSLLLGRAARRELSAPWLAGAFGLPAPLPVAALRRIAAGGTTPAEVGAGETAQTVNGDWICLDPVHLRVGREGVTLADPAELALDAAEAAALIAALAPLLAELGSLGASAPGQWELRLPAPAELDTLALPAAIGQPVAAQLPGGPAGKRWRRLLAEAQTLMHAHPVNRERDARGRPTVNSLWPWGAGALGPRPQAACDVAWSDDPVVQGLCALAGIPCLAPPERFHPASGRVLAHIDGLARPAREFDALNWRSRLLDLESRWLAPAISALQRGDSASIRLIGSDAGDSRAAGFELSRGALWRFWRRPRPLAALT